MSLLTKPGWRWAIVVLIILSSVAVSAWLYKSRGYSRFPLHLLPKWQIFESWRVQRTRNDIAAMDEAIHKFTARYGHLPVIRPGHEEQFAITLGHELNGVRSGVDSPNRESIVFWDIPAGEQLDGWQHNYHISIDVTGTGFVHPGGQTLKRQFAVWSDGANGKNENGAGDDIRDW